MAFTHEVYTQFLFCNVPLTDVPLPFSYVFLESIKLQ